MRDLVGLFRDIPNAKGSFATKAVNRDLLAYDPQGKTRIRFSLMPERIARVVDVRTAPIPERLAAIDDFVAAGYEVHVNFSPVILYEGWEADWRALFDALDAALGPAARRAAEGRNHPPDPQRRPARGQPRLASEGGGPALAPGHPGGEGLGRRRREPALPDRLEGEMAGAVQGAAGRTDAVLRGALRILRRRIDHRPHGDKPTAGPRWRYVKLAEGAGFEPAIPFPV